MMWNQTNLSEFQSCIQDLLNMPQVSRMEHIAQHVKDANCFQHSIFVAYLSFIVSSADKLCALAEIFRVYRWMKVDQHLDFLPKEHAISCPA